MDSRIKFIFISAVGFVFIIMCMVSCQIHTKALFLSWKCDHHGGVHQEREPSPRKDRNPFRKKGNYIKKMNDASLRTFTETTLNVPTERVRKLLISPDKVPSKLLHRLDVSTKRRFLSKLAKIHTDHVLNSSGNGTTWQNVEVDAYAMLRSMGYQSRLPDAINIGVKKAGTTALMFYLKWHPQIQTSLGATEVHYFDWRYKNGIHWYESRMKFARDDQVVFEKTPRYFVNDYTPKRIHRDLSGKVRFLLCVRDPVERIVSDFHFTKHIRSSASWKKKQTAGSESRRFVSTITNTKGALITKNTFISTSNYAFHFSKWLKLFDKEKFLIIDNSEMVTNITAVLHQVETFLGLENFYKNDMFVISKHGNTCLRLRSKVMCPPQIGKSVLPKPKLSESLESQLRDYFRPLNRQFEQLSGKTFPWTEL